MYISMTSQDFDPHYNAMRPAELTLFLTAAVFAQGMNITTTMGLNKTQLVPQQKANQPQQSATGGVRLQSVARPGDAEIQRALTDLMVDVQELQRDKALNARQVGSSTDGLEPTLSAAQAEPMPGSGPFIIPVLAAPGLNGSSTVLPQPPQKRSDEIMGMAAFNHAMDSSTTMDDIVVRQKNMSMPSLGGAAYASNTSSDTSHKKSHKTMKSSAASLNVGMSLLAVFGIVMFL